ncbi:MAG: hypothetical protein ACLPJW_15515 [Rhodomicrobium sp.]
MEPFKALVFLSAVGIVSLVGVGAAGFYAGYSAGRGNLQEIKAEIANAPVAIATGSGGAVSLKPVLEDIRALSKQVEALAAVKARPAGDAEQSSKPVVEEIKALARQIEALKSAPGRGPQIASLSASPAYTEALEEIRGQISALNTKFDKQEPKAPKALVDEIRSLSASVQAQEPAARRAIAEELRTAVAALQNAEPKVSKALMEEIHTISANVRPQDSHPQASVADQIKVLTAAIEALKSRLAEDSGRGRGDSGANAQIAQLQQLVLAASDQFGKCQTQLASLAGTGFQQAPAAPAGNTLTVAASARHEPSTVVFFDNVMLKKDQEKQYDEIGVRLALQSVGPRQVKVAVNRQGFGLAFGERKVFRSQDVECELNLMETNLNDSQARVSISCKR